ncbi:4'-phosphopantetheinyl transferase family protein [Streptomyces bohaiensis]|uniref:4'-phosphopantetheinyl transferase family protein n=1 Tax=Streptomyces bohaiensis TaxID=1431344 RepID=UPI003B774729
MIEQLLPASVVTEAAYNDAVAPGEGLFPAEAELISRAVDKRRREFTTVRHLARRGLARLGRPAAPILPNRRGAPQWPEGVIGSMTHCVGYRGAALAPAGTTAGLGIDAEPDGPLPDGVLQVVTLESERARLAGLAAVRPDLHWERLLFSAKESVFKVWYPLMLRELDFSEAEIVVDPHDGTFTARLLVPGPVVAGREVPAFTGRWGAGNGLVVTAIHLPGQPAAADPGPSGAAPPRAVREGEGTGAAAG